MTRIDRLFWLVAPLAIAAHHPATAQQAVPDEAHADDRVEIGADQASGNSGRLSVNIVAGSLNQQAGVAAIAIGEVAATTMLVQQDIGTPDQADRSTGITVGPNSFSGNSGLVSINLTAGIQNQSANLATLTVSNSGVVSDQTLAQTSAPTGPSGATAEGLDNPNDSIVIDDAAFRGNSGLVQINLIGGERSSSANTFALNVSAGGEE